MNPDFRSRLLAGDTLIGTLCALPSSEIVELLNHVGFDWLFLDAEHGAYGPETIPALLQAAGSCPALIRVPSCDEGWIKKVLDAGADGIIVPQIHTPEQAKKAIEISKYPPLGKRGVGVGRAHDYGRTFEDYLSNANAKTTIVLQAESEEAVDNIDEIAQTEGCDAILIGPYDLSTSLGHTGELDHPVVKNAISKIHDSCIKHDKRLGIFGVVAENLIPFMHQDFTLITVGVDTLFVNQAAEQALHTLRGAK